MKRIIGMSAFVFWAFLVLWLIIRTDRISERIERHDKFARAYVDTHKTPVFGMPMNFEVTAYCPEQCEKPECRAASEMLLRRQQDQIVTAVDHSCYEFGQVFFVEGLGYIVSVDTGPDVNGCERLDVWWNDCEAAKVFGRQYLWGIALEMRRVRAILPSGEPVAPPAREKPIRSPQDRLLDATIDVIPDDPEPLHDPELEDDEGDEE